MKKILSLLLVLALVNTVHAQDVPQGMKYQAVARSLKGEIIADKEISLKVTLFSGNLKNPVIHYSEVHTVKTNQLGLFSLNVGAGTDITPVKEQLGKSTTKEAAGTEQSNFAKIPWSTQEIWMDVAVKDNGSDFITISSSKLLTVPYAFHARTAGKIDPVADPIPVREDREWKWDNRCDCHGGIRAITLLYLGQSGVKIKAFEKSDLRQQDLVDSFLNVQNGDVIKLDATPRPDQALKSKTWFQILSGNTSTSTQISLIDMPTDCDTRAIGENFGNFSVLQHVDKRDSSVCSICDVRMEWKLDGNAVFDMCNWLGTKSYHDLRIITNNIERIRITKDQQMIIHDSLTVDQEMPTLLTGKLTVDQATELGQSLRVDGITDLQSSLNVNMNSPTWLTGTLRVDGSTDVNNSFNVNHNSPTLLTGTLRVDNDAVFKEKVLIDNPAHQSTSTTTGALVVAGGLGLGGNLNIGGSAKFGGATEFQGVVSITNASQSTSTTNGALVVTGGVGIGKRLNVGEGTDIGGTLNVAGVTSLNSSQESTGSGNGALVVTGGAGIGKNLNVQGATNITGNTTIGGITTLNNAVNINAGAGQVRITASGVGTADNTPGSYPLLVQGANQGMWIKVNSTTASSSNNFITFQDGDGTINGRIEGQNSSDLENEQEYKDWTTQLIITIALNTATLVKDGIVLVGAVAGTTPCAGTGVCVTVPPVAPIVAAVACIAITTAKLAQSVIAFQDYKALRNNNLGVTYASKGADYAEWLPKADMTDEFRPGEIVGVKGGFISRNTWDAEKIMVISHKPIVLGNSPPKNKESMFKMVAFMGQVPVSVYGKVEKGDYIIASGANDGFGVAVKGDELTVADYKKLVGIAWSSSDEKGIGIVTVAVGIGDNQVGAILEKQDKAINQMADQLNAHIAKVNTTNELLMKLLPGFAAPVSEPVVIEKPVVAKKTNTLPDLGVNLKSPVNTKPLVTLASIDPPLKVEKVDARLVYFKLNRTEVEEGIKLAEQMMKDQGQDVTKLEFFNKMNEGAYKDEFINKVLNEFDRNLKNLQRGANVVLENLDKQQPNPKSNQK